MKLIILIIAIYIISSSYAKFLSIRGKRDFVQLTPIATLTVTNCPSSGGGTISLYPSEACASAFDTSDDVNVFFICSGGTLTLYNAYSSNSPYTGSFIITAYSFGTATVTSGPAYFFSQSVTCTNDYCGNPYVSGCTTPSSQTSTTSGASIFVLQSGGETTVDLCKGGSASTCCSGVTTSNCPKFHGTTCTGAFTCSCNCPAQPEYPFSTTFNELKYCFPDTDGSNKCTFNAACNSGSCSTTADCAFPYICSGGSCLFQSCSTDSDCPAATFCSPNGCGSVCYPAGIGCTAMKREIPAFNSSSVTYPKSDGTCFCSHCSTSRCRMDCKGSDTDCCV